MFTLHRFICANTHTIGVLEVDGVFVCFTMERPWQNNEKDVSCIPTGSYSVVPYVSPKFGNCYLLKNVQGRDDILIHKGNWPRDTHGCILLGMTFGVLSHEPAILDSEKAFGKFGAVFTEPCELEVTI